MAHGWLPPGFRFHPTDEELVSYYLKRKVMGKSIRFMALSEVEIYKFAPWDLPEMSCLRTKDLEWYFFCPRDKKYPNGSRANRSTEIGYWKTTGKDRSILHDSRVVGMKKSLIFHTGKPPKGDRTDWVMYEYRLADDQLAAKGVAQDSFVVCKIFKKSGVGPKIGEQYGAPFNEKDWENDEDFEATVAAFPFLPCQQIAVPSSNDNNAITSIPEPVSVSAAATTNTEPVLVAVAATTSIDPVPASSSGTTILEPVPLSLGTISVATQSVAISAAGYEELLESSVPTSGTPQYGAFVPINSEMDGIQLDELVDLLSDTPYYPESISGQLAPVQPSPVVENFNDAAGDGNGGAYGELADLIVDGGLNEENELDRHVVENFNDAAGDGTGGIYGELADLIDGGLNEENELDRLGSTVANNDNVGHTMLSELGDQNFVELNDIVFDQGGDFFPNYYNPSPEMDLSAMFFWGDHTTQI
ncbi:NAC domain-containing protein 82 [Rhynchospora pubera]|uniref:NAC domain-containing protein 82 n=1 Tax=Rhynchospora pubera TaxID=906938 RepID=A0AAV8BXG8_9POAL|nr:NAC domain-containing protein 82 [Rhynchospora pubera]